MDDATPKNPDPRPPEQDETLGVVLLACLQEAEAGRALVPADWLARYPQFRDELKEFFGCRDEVERVAAPLRRAVQYTTATLGDDEETLPAGPGLAPDQLPSFGDYELLAVLGKGAAGVVYRARQISLDRLIALKMIRAGRLALPSERERFRLEAGTIAALDHPGIVPVYEVGEHGRRPYFTMKLIEGGSLAEGLLQSRAAPDTAARLVRDVARAVHHAHQRGVLHRDLKPSNILLDGEGRPHVTDFGLAKRVHGDDSLTETGAILGTPAYMAPEQARGGAVTTAADVYSLGAVLYALLTGRPPFRGDTPLATLAQVTETEAESPSRLNPLVDRNLATVCLKCLEKEPSRRYSSAEAAAQDLERWLTGEPVEARPVGQLSHLARWCRRNRRVAALAVITVSVLLASAVALALGVVLIDRERQEAMRQRDAANAGAELVREHLYAADVSRAYEAWRNLGSPRARALLDRHHPRDGEEDLRGFEWFFLWRLAHAERRQLVGHSDAAYHIRFSPDGNCLASASQDKTVKVTALRTGKDVGGFDSRAEANWVDFSPDGCLVASAGDDGKVKVWDRKTSKFLLTIAAHAGEAVGAVFSPDGNTIASGGDDHLIKLWDARTGLGLATLAGHGERIEWLAFTPDGKTLASVGRDGTARLWDVGARKLRYTLADRGIGCGGALTPDGQTLATAGNPIMLWDVRTGRKRAEQLHSHLGSPTLAFLDDKWLASSLGARIHVWNVARGELETVFNHYHHDRIWCVAFSPDGRLLASASKSGSVQAYDWRQGRECTCLGTHSQPVPALAYAPDGRTLATGHQDGLVRLWDVATRRIRRELKHPAGIATLAFTPDGRSLAVAVQHAKVHLWNPVTGEPGAILPGAPEGTCPLAFSPDGQILATRGAQGGIQLWDVARGVPCGGVDGRGAAITAAAFSPDGSRLLLADENCQLWWHDLATGHSRLIPPDEGQAIHAIAISPSGRTLATGDRADQVRLWNAASAQEMFMLRQTPIGVVTALAFAPDGKTLAVAGDVTGGESKVLLWLGEDPGPP